MARAPGLTRDTGRYPVGMDTARESMPEVVEPEEFMPVAGEL